MDQRTNAETGHHCSPPTEQGELGRSPEPPGNAYENYHHVAETIFGPSIRWRDNFYQAVFIVVVTALAALIGWLFRDMPGLVIGAGSGLLGSLLLSGIFL